MKILISKKEYYEKLFDVAKSVLPALIQNDLNSIKSESSRDTISYNSVNVAKSLLKEIGYSPNNNATQITSIKQQNTK